ncbi:hypothetical protein [Novosphingobium sp. KACC 22771]|uniref:hypothetical protein n=1 Tax=Novosphingobium sp. KACC 22771 TaxID=3025670 RepID=UPI003FD46363
MSEPPVKQNQGSPRLQASKVRTCASPTILLVWSPRLRLEPAAEAGSTPWLALTVERACSKQHLDRCRPKPTGSAMISATIFLGTDSTLA